MPNPPIYVFGAGKKRHQQIIIAHHFVLTGYGHWLPNDLRGSGSTELRQEKLEDLGRIHFGRKRMQPPREQIKAFYRQANPLLKFESFWFDETKRAILREAFAHVIKEFGYTVYACALCSNHVHFVVRRHKDDALTIWYTMAGAAADALRRLGGIHEDHPVWANRPYKVFLSTTGAVWDRIGYVEDNPEKEGLPRQSYDFVITYDGWPYH